MSENAELRNKEQFNDYQLYTRTRSRKSDNYHEFVDRIGREPNVIYPDGWYDWDIDRVIAGRGVLLPFHHARFKRVLPSQSVSLN